MNVPNALTIFRFVLIGVLLYFMIIDNYTIALIVFIVASLTDFLDGYIARKYSLITNAGKLLDPLADKLMLITALTCLCIKMSLPWVILYIVIARELILIVGGIILYTKKIVVYSMLIVKIATIGFAIGVGMTFLPDVFGNINLYVLYCSVALALVAFTQYLIFALKANKEANQIKN